MLKANVSCPDQCNTGRLLELHTGSFRKEPVGSFLDPAAASPEKEIEHYDQQNEAQTPAAVVPHSRAHVIAAAAE